MSGPGWAGIECKQRGCYRARYFVAGDQHVSNWVNWLLVIGGVVCVAGVSVGSMQLVC